MLEKGLRCVFHRVKKGNGVTGFGIVPAYWDVVTGFVPEEVWYE
jgi:hypothetical protein